MKQACQNRFWIGAILLLLLLLVPVLLTWRVWKQARLDHALIAHIKANDADAVIVDLRQGADANAHETVGDAPSFKQMLRQFFLRQDRQPSTTSSALCVALSLLYVYDPKDFEDRLPLLYPVAKNERLIKALLEAGANPNTPDTQGTPPIYWATLNSSVSTVKLLLEYHADVDAIRGLQRRTALHIAAWYGEAEKVQLLLEHGANCNAAERDGTTPLMDAAGVRDAKIVTLLLRYQANVNVHDKEGKTPVRYARTARMWLVAASTVGRKPPTSTPPEDIVSLLRQAGAKE